MANAKDIKGRFKSIRDTQKITNAMYMIASTKMRKAKSELDRTRPYFEALRKEINRLFRIDSNVESRYFTPVGAQEFHPKRMGCLVITADKGLAGAYNLNVIKQAQQLLAKYPDAKLFVVGEYGRRFFVKKNIPIEQAFLYTAQNPTMQRAREITLKMLTLFDKGEIDGISVIYTDFSGGMWEETRTTSLLPFHRAFFMGDEAEEPIKEPFEFVPDLRTVLETGVRSYVSGYIYSTLVDSFCSEQNARMSAMNSANDNAEKMLAALSVEYNRVRQAAITREITEVSAGAKAQKKKRMQALSKSN